MDTLYTYEKYFGLNGRPFSAIRDQRFYFESHGQRRVSAHLRNALLAGGCFMVVTGDPGTGKTMLVHELFGGEESDGFVLPQPDGHALDARGLLLALLSSFRTPASGDSLEELRADLDACLTTLGTTGRRPLVVIDDADDLLPDAIDELMRVAASQGTDESALLVLLVGRPALRANLPDIAQLSRLPTFLFCDLGVLSRSETQSYIEHRLHHVEWAQSPSISNEAHDLIYRATEGVPRRVNRLCDRVLIDASRQHLTSISAELVEEADSELREEIDVDDTRIVDSRIADVSSESVFLPGTTNTEYGSKVRSALASFRTKAADAIARFGLAARDAADRVGPIVRDAAVRVGPFARNAAARVGPTVRNAAARIGPIVRNAVAHAGPRGREVIARHEPKVREAFTRHGPKVRNAIIRYGWLAFPVAVFAGFIHSPADRNAISSLLGDTPRAAVRHSTGSDQPTPPLIRPLPHETYFAAQLDEARARRARDEARTVGRRSVNGVAKRGTERATPVVATNEAGRATVATVKPETSRSTQVAAKSRKTQDTAPPPGRQLASRSP